MREFNGLGNGMPTLGRKLKDFVSYARRQKGLISLECAPNGEHLAKAISSLIRAYDIFMSDIEFADSPDEKKRGG